MNNEEPTHYPDDYILPPMEEYTGLPPIQIREAIADAVHAGVLLEKAGHTLNKCLLYAGTAAAIAYSFTGRRYEVVCGFACFNKHRGKVYLADPRLISHCQKMAHHCWAVYPHGERIEIVDLSSRNFAKHAQKRMELDWSWAPNYVWNYFDEIASKYQSLFIANTELTTWLREQLYTRHLETLRRICDIAFCKMLQAGFTVSPAVLPLDISAKLSCPSCA